MYSVILLQEHPPSGSIFAAWSNESALILRHGSRWNVFTVYVHLRNLIFKNHVSETQAT